MLSWPTEIGTNYITPDQEAKMYSNRLFNVSIVVALLVVGALTLQFVMSTTAIMPSARDALLEQRQGEWSASGIAPNTSAALLEQRRGEWLAGADLATVSILDQHDRHSGVVAPNASAALLEQRRGEWLAGADSVTAAPLDQHERHP